MKNATRFIVTFASLTFLIGIGIGVICNTIAHRVIPDEIHHVSDGLDDINNRPAQYELRDQNGDVIGEFTFWNAVLYEISKSGSKKVVRGPSEIEFLSNWVFFIPAGIIAIIIIRLYPRSLHWW
jgi:hypothetical protein